MPYIQNHQANGGYTNAHAHHIQRAEQSVFPEISESDF